MNRFSPEAAHEEILRTRPKLLAFDPAAPYQPWKKEVAARLDQLLGDAPEPGELNVTVEWEKETDAFPERRVTVDAEPLATVPCHLLLPKGGKAPFPVVICLQGHSTGMHISLGRAQYEGDEALISGGDRDFALQIVREGYAALTVEQRGFGERHSDRTTGQVTCLYPSMSALLIGRTMVRERAFDVSRAIDAIASFPELDLTHIGLMGNSGGGTASYYAACLDPRIRAVMPSCAVCSFDRSIGARRHCVCNYVPNIARYFDMGELSCLIAPRPLIVVAGEKDTGFSIDGVEKVFSVIRQIYEKEGVPDNCTLIVGAEGHRFYADLAWGVFRRMFLA